MGISRRACYVEVMELVEIIVRLRLVEGALADGVARKPLCERQSVQSRAFDLITTCRCGCCVFELPVVECGW